MTNKILSKTFEIKDLGEASFVLGIEIYKDRSRSVFESASVLIYHVFTGSPMIRIPHRLRV